MKRFQYIAMLLPGLFVLLTSVTFASDKKEPPQENVRLTGKIYNYPFGIEGNPYLQEEWQDGNLFLENGKVAHHVKIRLNLIENDLIFYNETLKRVFSADKETIKSFVMNPESADSLFFVKYSGPEMGYRLRTNDFVQVLCEGKINFLVKHMAEVIHANELNSKDKVHPKIYYFVNTNNKTFEIKHSLKMVYNLYPLKKKEIKKLIVDNNLRKANEKNMTRLFELINHSPEF